MRLSELITIMSADPTRSRIGQRYDGQLDEHESLDQRIENTQLGGMDDVFGIVKNNRLSVKTFAPFV